MVKKNNIKNATVYKDFDDEVIPDGFVKEGWQLKKNRNSQFIEDLNGDTRAIKCTATHQWCKGTEDNYFTCNGCHQLYLEQDAKNEPVKASEFKKNDEGKLQWSLIPFEQLEDVVRVLMNGAKKYSPGNWKKCDDPTRYIDALMRHVTAYVEGQKFDTELDGDNLHHLAHAICDCLFIMYFERAEIAEFNKFLEYQNKTLMDKFEGLIREDQ